MLLIMFLLTRAPSEERSIKALVMYDTTMSLPALDAMIKDHELGKPFKATEVSIPQDECASWVKFRIEPQRFLPANFDGDWANTKLHPIEGKIRVIRHKGFREYHDLCAFRGGVADGLANLVAGGGGGFEHRRDLYGGGSDDSGHSQNKISCCESKKPEPGFGRVLMAGGFTVSKYP
jgi:hypothetical protein